jgi:hypothetical protein
MNRRAGIETQLHSRYNPAAEAQRYLDALELDSGIDCFILIEPGLGYLVPPLRKQFPASAILALHADSAFKKLPGAAGENIPAWYPDNAESVQDFLERHVPDAARTRVIEWRPALRLYGECCLRLLSETSEFLKRTAAGRRTAAVFGRKWVKNFFKNIAMLEAALLFKPFDVPVAVTGSGPGLESVCPLLAQARGNIFIIAASSSLPALAAHGIVSDMVISTDGGSWALFHLYNYFRLPQEKSGSSQAPLPAAALTAALPSQCAGLPVLALSDGSLWQSIALHAINFPALALPQRGTVSASAVDAALALTRGPVYLAGLDFSVRDICEHARPYGFDHLFFGCASRLRPVYSQYFARSTEARLGGSMDVYAEWFKKQLAAWPTRIFALDGNSAVFDGRRASLPPVNGVPRKSSWYAEHFKRENITDTAAQRRCKAVQALVSAFDKAQFSETFVSELSPLLFPGERDVSLAVIKAEMQNIGLVEEENCG